MRKRFVVLIFLLFLCLAFPACKAKETTRPRGIRAGNVDVIRHKGEKFGKGVYRVTGKVQNNTDGNASNIKVKISFKDASGNEVDKNEAPTEPNVLRPGTRAKFEVHTVKSDIASHIKSYEISVSFDRSPATPSQ